MALFAKKNSDTATKPAAADAGKAPKKGLPFGKKKAAEPAPPPPAAAPAGGVEDFSDFSDFGDTAAAPAAAPAVAAAPAKAGKAPKPEKKGLKGGAVVGLNIGNDSIKVVELKGKGTSVAVTAVGIAPTPPESISNGVVMSTSSLSSAIRDLLKSAGISTKRVVSSVSGSGALVVRVIEVPQMSDAELKGNMTQDADRYIPFPPSEVIMDFKALRQLPVGADGNMEVLLAAAQREIVDLHVNVLLGAKLDPQSVDVEPLAAARAMNFDGLSESPGGVDYSDVSALINIGATGTEITVLRGDLLVFTRSIPRGGHALTQTIADTLGLAMPDAERLKQELGDALQPDEGDGGGAPAGGADPFGDFADFGDPEEPVERPTIQPTIAEAEAAEHDWGGFDAFGTPEAPVEDSPIADTQTYAAPAASSAPTTTDPFDEGFFAQGPQGAAGQDPTERHAQKQDEGGGTDSAFDFSFDSLDDAPSSLPTSPMAAPDADNAPLPSMPDLSGPTRMGPDDTEVQPPLGSSGIGGDYHSALQPEEIAPSGQMFAFNAVDDPSLPSFPSLPAYLTAPPIEDEFASLPTVVEEAPGDIDADYAHLPTETEEELANPTVTSPAGFSFDFAAPPATVMASAGAPTTDELAALAGVGAPEAEVAAAPVAPLDFSLETPIETPTAPDAPASAGAAFDLDSLGVPDLAPVAATAPVAAAVPVEAEDDFAAVDAGAAFGAPDFNDDFAFDAGGFGAGLVGGEISDDITAATIYGIIHPQLEEMAGEVRRSLEYFGSRYPDAGVRRITLVGGGAKLRNIDVYFTRELGIPTTRGNPFGGVAMRAPGGSEFISDNAPLFAVALGLALRDVA